jgi:hypothetical protein
MPSTPHELEYARRYYREHRDKKIAYSRAYYADHREQEAEWAAAYKAGRSIYAGRLEVCPDCGRIGYVALHWGERRLDARIVDGPEWRVMHYVGVDARGKARYEYCMTDLSRIPLDEIAVSDEDRLQELTLFLRGRGQ